MKSLGSPPQPPLDPLLTFPSPTFEGLCSLFAVGQPSLGIFAPEGGQFIGGHSMRTDLKLHSAAGFSSLWDGEPVKLVQKGVGRVVLPGRRLSMHLMVQPDASRAFFGDRVLMDQGLLSRVLVVVPESEIGKRPWRDPLPKSAVALKNYQRLIGRILGTPLPLASNMRNELRPRLLTLSPRARRHWIAFSDALERAMGKNGRLRQAIPLVNKLAEHAARLAAVLALIQDLKATTVHSKFMDAGIELARFYANQGLKLMKLPGSPTYRTSSRGAHFHGIAQKLRQLGESKQTVVLAGNKPIPSQTTLQDAVAIRRTTKDGNKRLLVKSAAFSALFEGQHTQVAIWLHQAGILRATSKSGGKEGVKTYTRQERTIGSGKANFYVIDWEKLLAASEAA